MISREEAINELKIMRNLYSHIRRHDREWESTELAIEALSQPERPKGRYIPDNRYQTLGNCSLCNGDLTMLDNFCPKCGCDMRGEHHD